MWQDQERRNNPNFALEKIWGLVPAAVSHRYSTAVRYSIAVEPGLGWRWR